MLSNVKGGSGERSHHGGRSNVKGGSGAVQC